MKIFNVLIPLVLIVMAAGCESHPAQTASTTTTVTRKVTQTSVPAFTAQQAATNAGPQQIITDNAIYTIETIPNPRLSATSREGDKTSEVYSSNIIAVHVQPRYGARVNSTNSTAAPSPQNNPQP